MRLDAIHASEAEAAWLQRLAVTPVKVQSKADRAAKLPPCGVAGNSAKRVHLPDQSPAPLYEDGGSNPTPHGRGAPPQRPTRHASDPSGAVDVLLPAVANLPIGPFVTFVYLAQAVEWARLRGLH